MYALGGCAWRFAARTLCFTILLLGAAWTDPIAVTAHSSNVTVLCSRAFIALSVHDIFKMAASGSSALEREFLQAIADFKTNSNLSPKELQDFQLTKLSDLEAAMSQLQQRQSQTKRLRYMKRMEPFLETMKDYGKVVEVFLNTSNILAFVWVSNGWSFQYAPPRLSGSSASANVYLLQGPLKYIILVRCRP